MQPGYHHSAAVHIFRASAIIENIRCGVRIYEYFARMSECGALFVIHQIRPAQRRRAAASSPPKARYCAPTARLFDYIYPRGKGKSRHNGSGKHVGGRAP